jgi:hypothetical protein
LENKQYLKAKDLTDQYVSTALDFEGDRTTNLLKTNQSQREYILIIWYHTDLIVYYLSTLSAKTNVRSEAHQDFKLNNFSWR